jgi:bacillopeptidase F
MKGLRGVLPILALLGVGTALYGQNAFLDQPLYEALDEASENDLIPIVLMLEETVDLFQLKADFNARKIPAKQRAPLVELALKEKAESTQSAVLAFLESSGLNYGSVQTFWIANAIALEAEPALVEALANRNDIAYIYLNRSVFGYVEPPLKSGGIPKSEGGIEPGLEAIGAPEMWAMGYTGHGRIAMTFDTGVWDDHPSHNDRFLANRMPLETTWFGYDSPTPVDKSSSHGTHVTGIMLGLDKATDDTIGVAPEAYYIATDPVVSNLAFVKPLTDFMFGYEWAIDPDGDPETVSDIPDVINNSWGFGPDLDEEPCPDFVIPVFTAVEAAGIANVFSAGNEGPGDLTMSVPHNTNIGLVNSFTVGATAATGSFLIANFSSRGPSICGGEGSLLIKPEVSAPGVNVRSSIENGEYDFFSGTSMAAPHVSGAVLLLKEAFPEVTGEEILLSLYNSATDLGLPGEDNTYGMGFINVKAAYDLLAETHTPTPPLQPGPDLELTAILSPTELIRCASEEGSIAGVVEVANAGTESIDGFTLHYSIVGETEELSFEVTESLAPGDSLEVALPELTYEGTGFREYHVRIEPFEDEYDVLNNHGVYRWTELPKYDLAESSLFEEDFNDGIDPEKWTIVNPDAWVTWDTLTAIQSDGSQGISAYVNHPSYLTIASQDDYLISPLLLNNTNTGLFFDYYYRKRSSNDFTQDTLMVYISQGCNTEPIELWRKGGEQLWTNDDSETDAYPESAEEWSTVFLPLEPEGFDASAPFHLSFITLNRRGNNILLDNIQLGSQSNTTNPSSDMGVAMAPNPAREHFRLTWKEESLADVVIFDLSGRMITAYRRIQSGAEFATLSLSPGIYVVQVNIAGQKVNLKLVVN